MELQHSPEMREQTSPANPECSVQSVGTIGTEKLSRIGLTISTLFGPSSPSIVKSGSPYGFQIFHSPSYSSFCSSSFSLSLSRIFRWFLHLGWWGPTRGSHLWDPYSGCNSHIWNRGAVQMYHHRQPITRRQVHGTPTWGGWWWVGNTHRQTFGTGHRTGGDCSSSATVSLITGVSPFKHSRKCSSPQWGYACSKDFFYCVT